MMPFKELVLASHNAGKLKELQAMLGDSVKVRSIAEFSEVEPEETGLSFVENAILKARNAAPQRDAAAVQPTRCREITADHKLPIRRKVQRGDPASPTEAAPER